MAIDFAKLEAARVLRGHSVREAVAEIGISSSLWYVWKAGRGENPLKALKRAADRYIKDAQTMEGDDHV